MIQELIILANCKRLLENYAPIAVEFARMWTGFAASSLCEHPAADSAHRAIPLFLCATVGTLKEPTILPSQSKAPPLGGRATSSSVARYPETLVSCAPLAGLDVGVAMGMPLRDRARYAPTLPHHRNGRRFGARLASHQRFGPTATTPMDAR